MTFIKSDQVVLQLGDLGEVGAQLGCQSKTTSTRIGDLAVKVCHVAKEKARFDGGKLDLVDELKH